MLTSNRLGGFTPIGLPQNANNLFGIMRFAFHEYFSISFKKYSPLTWVNYRRSSQYKQYYVRYPKYSNRQRLYDYYNFVRLEISSLNTSRSAPASSLVNLSLFYVHSVIRIRYASLTRVPATSVLRRRLPIRTTPASQWADSDHRHDLTEVG